MPYVVCPRCDATNYVARSALTRADPCPICDEPLTDATRVVWPARPGPVVDRRGR